MHGLVVYESMFGNTRQIAEAVADGLKGSMDIEVLHADSVPGSGLSDLDLVVVGAPTHVRGMPRPGTRKGAPDNVSRPGSSLVLEPEAESRPGVREWLASLGGLRIRGAAFDTRIKGSATLTGQASRGIARSLKHVGVDLIVPPESFLVDKKTCLLPGELDRARAWGVQLAESPVAQSATKS
jgi:Flavodoxin domain